MENLTDPSAIMAQPARLRRAATVASLGGLVTVIGVVTGDLTLYEAVLAGVAASVTALSMLFIAPRLWRYGRRMLGNQSAKHPGRSPAMSLQVQKQAMARLQEAAQTWTTHLGTAQAQQRQAIEQMLAGFERILKELDSIVENRSGTQQQGTEEGAAVLAHCEEELKALIEGFDGFVKTREEIVGAMRSLAGSSDSLKQMAEDVGKLSRQTALLSINASIEAARAGTNGRGFAIVASEVRRLSAESGTTGTRIGETVACFAGSAHTALERATHQSKRDGIVIQSSGQTIERVVGQVGSVVEGLNKRASELNERGHQVRAQVEQLMVAFQFQDRVQQITDQVRASILSSVDALGHSLAHGEVPSAEAWQALLSMGYTTSEQRVLTTDSPVAASETTETTFF